MKRINQHRDLFEANPGEVITVAIEASRVPYQATFSDLGSGNNWTKLQEPTPRVPVERRRFIMPPTDREFFDIVYAFPPSDQVDPAAKYMVTISSDITDGPNDVFPPFVGDITDLFYEFRLPETAPGTAAALMAVRALPRRLPTEKSKRGSSKGR